MNTTTLAGPAGVAPDRIHTLARSALGRLERIPSSALLLIGRLAIADVFWRSGETKVDGWRVTDSAVALFRDEYRLPLLPPDLAATLAATAEHLFPLLLVLGLAARLGAAGLFAMTLVIEFFVYPESWPDHLLWSSVLLPIIAYGPGALSLDHLIRRRVEGRGGQGWLTQS